MDKIGVNFACQRCLQPIVLNEQLDNISIHASAELSCKLSTPSCYYYLVTHTLF